jgi:anaerobic selenocysteine-containing dehydrogenase
MGDTARIREAIARIVPGFEALGDIDRTKQEFQIAGRTFHEPRFATPDGRARLHTHDLPELQGTGEGEIRVMTLRSEGQFNTIIYEETDSYRGNAGRQAVFLNREDMAAFGVTEGESVAVVSDTGRMQAIVTAFDLPRGSAMAYYPEANVLVGTEVDPRSRTPAFKSIPVRIEALAG